MPEGNVNSEETSIIEELSRRPDFNQILEGARAYFSKTPQEEEAAKIIAELEARDDFAQILEGARNYYSKSAVPKISRRRLLRNAAALALAAGTGFGLGRATSTPTKDSRIASLPESANEEVSSFNELIKPLIDEAHRRRDEWAKDPEFYHRVDKELNANLLNIGLIAWSKGRGESLTVLSYNLVTGKITSISCTRETITPEAIRFNKQKNPNKQDIYSEGLATNMFLYSTGGWDLVRRVIEDETGLSADFAIYLDDVGLHDFIKEVAGDGVEIEVQNQLHLADAEFDKRWGWDPNGFVVPPGRHRMTATQAMRFILASDVEVIPGIGKGHTPPGRKNDIIRGALHAASEKFKQDARLLVTKSVAFLGRNKLLRHIDGDFDLIETVRALAEILGKIKSGQAQFGLPEVEKDDLMINDEFFGDGGIMRVHRFINEYGEPSEEYYKYAHPNMQKLVDQTIKIMKVLKAERIDLDDPKKGLATRGVLPLWAQVPILGDTEAEDLVTGYWPSTRKLVKERLSS